MRLVVGILMYGLLVGCATGPRLAEPIQTMSAHPRLFYRSLVSEGLQVDGCPAPNVLAHDEKTSFFIAFPADRWNLSHGDARWRDVFTQLDRAKSYALVGHARSHEAGAALVAQRRATVVRQLLIEAGFSASQLQTLARWGQVTEGEGSGVMILEISSDRGLWGWPRTVHHSSYRTKKGG